MTDPALIPAQERLHKAIAEEKVTIGPKEDPDIKGDCLLSEWVMSDSADRIWGKGNWVVCYRDDHRVYRADGTPMTPIIHSREYHV